MVSPTKPRRSSCHVCLVLGPWLLAQCAAPTSAPEHEPVEGSIDRPSLAARMHGDARSVASTLRTTAWVQLLLADPSEAPSS